MSLRARATFALGSCGLVTLGFLAFAPDCRHWFVLPVLACGTILAFDAIAWARGEMDALDPRGLVALLGLHVFFLAPLLQASQDYWLEDFAFYRGGPDDWRPWVGRLTALAAVGLLAYRRVSAWALGWTRPRIRGRLRVDSGRLLQVLGGLMVVSLVLQIGVYCWYGGIEGYREAMRWGMPGMGRLLVVAESLPLLASIAFVVWTARREVRPSPALLASFLAVLPILALAFGGLRGSRSSLVWVLFVAVGLLHFFVRAVSRKTVLAGLVVLVAFMYGYGFYKWGGARTLATSESRAEWLASTNKTLLRTLVFDLGRTNVQAALLYRLSAQEGYEYALGRTYLASAALVVPRSLWSGRPERKAREATELLGGREAFTRDSRRPGEFRVTWIYGLAGEALLNFGPVAVPVAFVLLGLVVGGTRALVFALPADDGKRLLLPVLLSLSLLTLVMDSDNLLVHLVRYAAPPAVAVLVASRFPVRQALTARPAACAERGA